MSECVVNFCRQSPVEGSIYCEDHQPEWDKEEARAAKAVTIAELQERIADLSQRLGIAQEALQALLLFMEVEPQQGFEPQYAAKIKAALKTIQSPSEQESQ